MSRSPSRPTLPTAGSPIGADATPDAAEPSGPAAPGNQTLWQIFRRLGPAGPLAILAGSTPAIAGFTVLGSLYWIAPWFKARPLEGLLVYVLAYAVLGGLALMPTYAHAILGGWAFGFALGLPAAMTAFGAAAVIAYAIGRLAAGDRVVRLVEEHARARAVYRALLGSGFWKSTLIVTLIRIPPNSPFAITNLALAASRVNPLAYLLGTVAGMAPRTAVAIFIGAGLSQLTFESRPSIWVLASGAAATLAVLAILGVLGKNAIARATAGDGDSRSEV